MENSLNQGRPRRREYSKQFKAEVLERCAQPGASVGGVELGQALSTALAVEQRTGSAIAVAG